MRVLSPGRSNDHTCDAWGLGQELQRWRTLCASWARARAHLLLLEQFNVHVVETCGHHSVSLVPLVMHISSSGGVTTGKAVTIVRLLDYGRTRVKVLCRTA